LNIFVRTIEYDGTGRLYHTEDKTVRISGFYFDKIKTIKIRRSGICNFFMDRIIGAETHDIIVIDFLVYEKDLIIAVFAKKIDGVNDFWLDTLTVCDIEGDGENIVVFLNKSDILNIDSRDSDGFLGSIRHCGHILCLHTRCYQENHCKKTDQTKTEYFSRKKQFAHGFYLSFKIIPQK